MKTLRLTPTWAAVMPIMIAVLENPEAKNKESIREELMRLAQFADRMISAKEKPHA